MNIREILERNPVIPALQNDDNLKEAIESSSEIVFLIMANLINVKDIVTELKKAGKLVFVHVDMIEGLSSSNYGVEYLIKIIEPDGIITTKHNMVTFARKNNIAVIQRYFILDSFSFKNTISQYLIKIIEPDGIITTKHNMVTFARKNNIAVIQRYFILDSFSFKNTISHIRENKFFI